MKKRFYKVLNVIIVKNMPTSNFTFLHAIGFELFLMLLVWLTSLFTKGVVIVLSGNIIHFLIGHIAVMLLAWGLFQKFKNSKMIQIFPTISIGLFHFEFSYWCSIFFGQECLQIFFYFMALTFAYLLLNFFYQVYIIEKIQHLPWRQQNNLLYSPALFLTVIGVILMILTRVFAFPVSYLLWALQMLSTAYLPLTTSTWTQVFTFWRVGQSDNGYNSTAGDAANASADLDFLADQGSGAGFSDDTKEQWNKHIDD